VLVFFSGGIVLPTPLEWDDKMQLDTGVEVAFTDKRRFARIRLLEDVCIPIPCDKGTELSCSRLSSSKKKIFSRKDNFCLYTHDVLCF
jgi:hypothetical protein